MQNATPAAITVLALELVPAALFGFAGERVAQACARWPSTVRTALPVLCALPYVLISYFYRMFSWEWCALYALLPVAIAWLLAQAAIADPQQRGNWRDAIVLLTLGLAVDLRWFERAWPDGLAGWGKLLLVDAALYGFLAIRQLSGTGFDFHFHWTDWKTGLRELAFFAPLVLALGIALGFLHPHSHALRLSFISTMIPTWIYIFTRGCKICWNAAWDGERLSRLRRFCSASPTSTNGRLISTGAMFCWPALRGFSTAGHGASGAAFRPRRSPTPAWMPSGRFGFSVTQKRWSDGRLGRPIARMQI